MTEDDLEDIRQEKMEEMREQERQEQEAEKKAQLRQVLTEKARERLENVRLADEEKAEMVENSILHAVQTRGLDRINEQEMIQILKQAEDDQEYSIKSRDL